VHINNDKCIDCNDLIFRKFLSHKHDSLDQLLVLFIKIIFNTLSTIGSYRIFDFSGPVNLAAIQNALTWVTNDPIISRSLLIVND
jgi:hypothetical protein